MPAFPPRTDLVDTYPNPSVTKLKAGLGSLWDAVTGLLGTAGTKAAARATLGVEAAEVDVASAATCDIGAAESMNVRITGTAGISSFGTAAAGVRRHLRFAGALTITHNTTSLILPGGGNINVAAGDTAEVMSLGDGNWIMVRPPFAKSGAAAPEKRQTVLSGPVDANGYPDFGGATGTSTLTASGTIKATCMAGGDDNRTGTITNPAFTCPTGTGTGYLMLGIDAAGGVTSSVRNLEPKYQFGGFYDTTAGQITVNVQEGVVKAGNGTIASQVFEVCIGECSYTSGVWSGTPTWYAIKGRYVSADTAIPGSGVTTIFNHNIGCKLLVRAALDLVCYSAEKGWAVGEVYENPLTHFAPGSYVSGASPVGVTSKNSVSITTGSGPGRFNIANRTSGALDQPTSTSWKMRTTVNRGW